MHAELQNAWAQNNVCVISCPIKSKGGNLPHKFLCIVCLDLAVSATGMRDIQGIWE